MPTDVLANNQVGISTLLLEIVKLGGFGRRVPDTDTLHRLLAELVRCEGVKQAALWSTPELNELSLNRVLHELGVQIISPGAERCQCSTCDLGVTGVDLALAQTGTLFLRTSPERPRWISLLPRIHLAIVEERALRGSLVQALAELRGEDMVAVTGPSRTADIEMTLALGVHGPSVLHVWAIAPKCRSSPSDD
jgi:L-lactate dehydrogenase complex protein LldG